MKGRSLGVMGSSPLTRGKIRLTLKGCLKGDGKQSLDKGKLV